MKTVYKFLNINIKMDVLGWACNTWHGAAHNSYTALAGKSHGNSHLKEQNIMKRLCLFGMDWAGWRGSFKHRWKFWLHKISIFW